MKASFVICCIFGIALGIESALLPHTKSVPTCPDPAGEYPEFFPDPDSCDHYYMCSNGVPVLMPCAPGLWWSQEKTTCVPEGQTSCDLPICPNPQGTYPVFFSDPATCDHYYVCSNGIPIYMTCAKGLWWDQAQLTCVLAETVICLREH